MDIEPLLKKLSLLAPQFGRAREDIEAMVSRGRSGDYKGVMQNARLVLETLLRAMVTSELKQTPGKAMLDELITKFRQQANAGVIPTNLLAHMGTVQAWGNLSSHDHAGGLADAGVKVGEDEVVASLNSMVAILTWYAGKYPASPTMPGTSATPAPAAAPAAAPSSKGPLLAGLGAVVILGGVGAAFALGAFGSKTTSDGRGGGGVELAAVDPTAARARLDALFATGEDPAPPAACRATADTVALAGASGSLAALERLPEPRSSESWYLLAKARLDAQQPVGDALDKALACPGFAAALNLKGKVAIAEKRTDDAVEAFRATLQQAPGFNKARLNLALVLLKQQKITEGIAELRALIQSQPKHADAHFFLAVALEGQGQKQDAATEFCEAWRLGKADAKSHCPSP
ncbi:MAG: tetratricopeptide repeat protein [Myxococcaceae bacterium]|nr:tetratricopeptide repeat protein [Myxococcaceae bacterium]